MMEVADAVISVWGADRVGMHLAPRSDSHDMSDSNPAALFLHVARELGRRKIAFICAREHLAPDRQGPDLKKAFGGVYIVNESFDEKTAEEVLAKGEADAVAFGKLFIANPDLPRRFAEGAKLNEWDSSTFYAEGPEGYTDYEFLPPEALRA